MPRRQSSTDSSHVSCIDLAALGARLRRFRQWRGYSQAAFAKRAGVDAMVLSRLEGQQKPRLEVETAAKLARACGWSLDQLCGLAPVPALPVPTAGYTPRTEGLPAWLAGGLLTTTEDRQLAAHILAWQLRGATPVEIAATLTAWGVQPLGGKTWTVALVQTYYQRYAFGTKAAGVALLRKYGLSAEARQLAAKRGAHW